MKMEQGHGIQLQHLTWKIIGPSYAKGKYSANKENYHWSRLYRYFFDAVIYAYTDINIFG